MFMNLEFETREISVLKQLLIFGFNNPSLLNSLVKGKGKFQYICAYLSVNNNGSVCWGLNCVKCHRVDVFPRIGVIFLYSRTKADIKE